MAKTRAMLISTKQKYKDLQNQGHCLCVKIKGMELETVMKIYLGINIGSSLHLKVHIKAILSKVSRAIGFFPSPRYIENTLKRYC